MKQTIHQLAHEIKNDPEEQRRLSLIKIVPRAKPVRFKAQLKETAKTVADMENTFQGMLARIELLEHRLDQLTGRKGGTTYPNLDIDAGGNFHYVNKHKQRIQ